MAAVVLLARCVAEDRSRSLPAAEANSAADTAGCDLVESHCSAACSVVCMSVALRWSLEKAGAPQEREVGSGLG